jgi:hypothetical protein
VLLESKEVHGSLREKGLLEGRGRWIAVGAGGGMRDAPRGGEGARTVDVPEDE